MEIAPCVVRGQHALKNTREQRLLPSCHTTQPNPPAFGRWKYIPHPGRHELYRSSLSFDLGAINNHRELKKNGFAYAAVSGINK